MTEARVPKKSIFDGKFLLIKLIGKGGFGEVYEGVQTPSNEPVAIKMERNDCKNSFLFHEARVMQDIQKKRTQDGITAIATLRYFGQEGDYRVLIMSLQGPSLEDLLDKMGRFTLKTTVLLGMQLLLRLEYIHSVGYVHRDLKTDNFLIGRTNPKRIFLIDFGLSTKYVTSDGSHRPLATDKSFLGTSRFASLRTHHGFSQSRRDDLEQIAYNLIYMYRGRLPWSGLNIKDQEAKEKRIGQLKGQLSVSQICDKCPSQFEDLLFYSRNISYKELPQYDMCQALLKSILEEMNPQEKLDQIYDWELCAKSSKHAASVSQGTSPATNQVNKDGKPQKMEGAPNILSNAKAQGVLSGLGSSNSPQNIVSIDERV